MLLPGAVTAVCLWAGADQTQANEPLRFNRDVRPILAENCLFCHGPDPASRKAGLRLDTAEGLLEKTETRGPVLVPGRPEESPLYQRIIASDPDEVMPPPDSHKKLKPEEIALLKRWIEEGGHWQPHWAFLKPERPPMPEVPPELAPRVRTPIDAFVFSRLAAEGLAPEPEADRRTLARRLSLDLIGLPPSPEEVEAFVADPSPDYYEKYVDRLLASPHYGEHRARYWLDAARYGDTHGLHFDNYREIWPYRDWVIKAFNQNQPFDQFTIEQIAGDLLPEPTLDQLVATGFHRCNVTTNEGGTIEEENLANYARDRVETTSWVFLGLTANCAACHDHKFDPITMKDFYQMEAFFRNTKQRGLDGNVKDGASPHIVVPQTEEDRMRWAALPKEIQQTEAQLAARRKEAAPEFRRWLASAKADDLGPDLTQDGLVAHVPLTEGAGDEIDAMCGGPKRFKATGPVTWRPDGKIGPAPVLVARANFDLGNEGDFERDQPFSYGAWVRTAGNNAFAGIIAKMDEGNGYRGWDLWQSGAAFSAHIIHRWSDDAIKVTTKENVVRLGEWQHVFVTYDGSSKAGGVRIFVDGRQIPVRVEADALRSSILTPVSLRLGQRSRGQVFEGGSVQDVRVYSRRLSAEEVRRLYQESPIRSLLTTASSRRTPEQEEALFNYYLTAHDAPYQVLQKTLEQKRQERAAIQERSPITHIQEERMDQEPKAYVLLRGAYDQKGEEVRPGVFHTLHPLPENAPRNRLGLAQWLVSPENPLTSRVTVNRFWQEIFGTGIVKTPEDFGLMGDPPSNQDLLDWLAVEFRESGWDVKRFFRLVVLSSTYRQSARISPEKLAKDPENRLLSRGPRFRMDAEMVRDYALAASGLLSRRIGGPPVKPYQPPGIWEVVGMAEGNTRIYKQDHGEALYRRSLYSFWKRMAPPASLEIFNAPSREVSCVRRERTNTPLQALVTLNDTQFVEAARVLATAALKASPETDHVLDFLGARLLARPFRPEERGIIKASFDDAYSTYRADPQAAAALLAVGEMPVEQELDPALLAAWTLVTNQLMNLDEVLNK